MFGLNDADKEFITLVITGLGLLIIALFKLQQRARLYRTGIATEGVVIRLEQEGYRRPTYYPVVRFLTPEQECITARYDVGTNPASFAEGDSVQLRFDPADPTCFIITSENSGLFLWLFFLVGIGLITYGIMKYYSS
ncbi:DUF3592 domain-containing protein [Hymenobacter sp. BT186]|uniref:DUF3592 domain-containing protein n=1 Tax=Hymenobacter telluris TaxID=2816474 RepID=A0A939EY64_9BACT|nr:DUF3592 domain-containing protein [Hymenobacter telluris]MBO0359374.1 DUF3592 domain-containing protein [Hymenobacter telluris]MBW3375400.1 DUF3592 domain-containing protein [Hymenobacter norwichensis]